MDSEQTQTIRIVVDATAAKAGSAEARQALADIEEHTGRLSEGLTKMGEGFESVKRFAEGFIAVKVAEKLLEIFAKAQEAAAAIEKLSSTLGVSTTFVQAAQFAAGQAGVKADDMGTAFTRLSNTIGQAADGNKKAIDSFNLLGVNVLDSQGKLRSTEVVMADVAHAMISINDPAQRVAMAVQLFGRNGASVIPMLTALAQGSDIMAAKAEAAGAVMGEEVVAQMHKLEAQSQLTGQKWNTLVATLGAPIATEALSNFGKFLDDVLDKIRRANGSWSQFLSLSLEASRREGRIGSGPGALRLETPEERNQRQQEELDNERKLNANNPAYAGRGDLLAQDQARIDAQVLADSLNRQSQYADFESSARVGSLAYERGNFGQPIPNLGGRNPTPTGQGQSLQNRLEKLNADAKIALDGARAAAAAADQGSDAVARLEQHTKDLKEVTDAYIKSGMNNKDAIAAQVAALDALNDQTRVQNALRDLGVKAYTLQQQNDETDLQLRLQGQTTDEIARQLALHKEIVDAKSKGEPLDSRQLQAMEAAINRQYDLKVAVDATQKSTALWLQPFSQAINGVQSGFEALFETVLKNGKNAWSVLADTLKSVFIKLFAELAVIAVVRPVLQPILGSVFSPAAMQQFGFGPGVGAGGLGNVLGGGGGGGYAGGGGGLGGMFGSSATAAEGDGWLSRQFSSIGSWLGSPIIPDNGALAPGMFGPPQAGLGGLTYGSAIGGIGSIGMGAYQMLSGGGSASSMLSGGASILGGGLALLGPMLGLGAAAGPIGIGLALAASILPSILGGGGPVIPPMPGLNYQGGGLGFGASNPYAITSGGAYASGASAIGQSVLGLIAQSGGTPIAGKLYGGWLGSGTTHTWDGKQWAGQNYTEANLSNPDGSFAGYIGGTGQGVSVQAAGEALTAQIFKADVLNGAIKGVSDTLVKVFTSLDVYTVKATQDAITFSAAYDKLGKAANPVKDAIEALNQKFSTLAAQAANYGLSLDPVDAELAKQTQRTAQDFIDNMVDPLAVQMRALDDERQAALSSAQYIKDNITGVYVDIDKITAYYTNKQSQLVDQFYSGAVSRLQELLQQLTYGDLVGASPSTALSGTRGAYLAGLAQAQSGDTTAITNLSALAGNYVTSARNYYGSSPEFQAIVEQVRAAVADEVGTLQTGGPGASPNDQSAAAAAVIQSNAQASQENAALRQQVADLTAQMQDLMATMQRLVVNR